MRALVVGGGIGGLATALSLHERGIDATVFERSSEIRELGVGINTLPHAIAELSALGLLDAIDAVAIRTRELTYMNRFGQTVWHEPRGTWAGFDAPQFSVHRGRLQGVLAQAVRERLGARNLRTDRRLVAFEDNGGGVTARFENGAGEVSEHRGDLLVAADGIHSTVRASFYPREGPPSWNGIMLWRGALEREAFATGASMIVAGDMREKVVVYPIGEGATPETRLTNWAVAARIGDGDTPPPRREDWSRPGRLDDVLAHVRRFSLPGLDIEAMIRATPVFYEYPMCDRDPVPAWTFGRVTLLGDAAHPMYPVGSNGASQAVLDARALARHLSTAPNVEAALRAYEAERLPATAEIVRQNRSGGPERVVDAVSERAPDGFERLEDVISHAELEAIVKGYAQTAGFSREKLAQR